MGIFLIDGEFGLYRWFVYVISTKIYLFHMWRLGCITTTYPLLPIIFSKIASVATYAFISLQ